MTGRAGLRRGEVSQFDERRGLGEVVGEDGTPYSFHSTQIADGSRRIEVGSRVVFVPVPGHLGRFEASQVTQASLRARRR
ncbi:MAG TPA: hypothetical protein VMR97_04080 [Acidimicrobiales bacterium]|nr:hypothetical protein [Acidimicrobiales bacterium]